MIKAVFFDFYGTLAGWEPAASEIQRQAAAAENVTVDPEAIDRAYPTANALLDRENAAKPLAKRSANDRDSFFAEYERTLLAAAGHDVPLSKAARVWQRVRMAPKGLGLYPDSLPALRSLHDKGFALGVISNMGMELPDYLHKLDIARFVPISVSSEEVGVAKPDPAVFWAALSKAKVTAEQALHVGDGYESDVLGARAAGLRALYLLRETDAQPPEGCPCVRSLTDVLPYVQGQAG